MGLILRLKRRTNKWLRKVGLMERTSRRRVKKHTVAPSEQATPVEAPHQQAV